METGHFGNWLGIGKGKCGTRWRKVSDFSKVPRVHHHNQIHINQFLYSILAEEKCQKQAWKSHIMNSPASGKRVAGRPYGFRTKRRVICKQIVDCTGGAEVVGLLGLERLRGEERHRAHTSSRLEILTILHQANSNALRMGRLY